LLSFLHFTIINLNPKQTPNPTDKTTMALITLTTLTTLAILLPLTLLAHRILYNLHFHPLSKFPGPWYLSVSSLPLAITSLLKIEPYYLLRITRKYSVLDHPIRIAPTVLLFPKPSTLGDIYWAAGNNTRG